MEKDKVIDFECRRSLIGMNNIHQKEMESRIKRLEEEAEEKVQHGTLCVFLFVSFFFGFAAGVLIDVVFNRLIS